MGTSQALPGIHLNPRFIRILLPDRLRRFPNGVPGPALGPIAVDRHIGIIRQTCTPRFCANPVPFQRIGCLFPHFTTETPYIRQIVASIGRSPSPTAATGHIWSGGGRDLDRSFHTRAEATENRQALVAAGLAPSVRTRVRSVAPFHRTAGICPEVANS